MSVQTCQYLIWGIRIPYKENNQLSETHREFMDDSAFKDGVKHKDGIFCLFDGMNGDFIIIGRVLAKAKDGELLGSPPIALSELTDLEKELILNSIHRNFNIQGEPNYYFVTMYR